MQGPRRSPRALPWAVESRPCGAFFGFSDTLYSYGAALGEEDDAFDYLEKAFELRDGSLALLKVDQRVDRLRDDPRFSDLLWRVGLHA